MPAPRTEHPMATLYRATVDAIARKGACFAEVVDHAVAYTSNQGFGGPDVYGYEVDGDVLDAADCRDLADAYLDLLTEDERETLDMDRADIIDAFRDCGGLVFHAIEGHSGSRRGGVPALSDVLARGFAWVRYPDDFPAGCMTRVYIGEGEIAPATAKLN